MVRGSADPQAERRRARFALRDILAQIATNPRNRGCGRYPLADGRVQVRRNPTEAGGWCAHFAKVQLCGSIWTCPVCGPRIRQARAVDVDLAASWFLTHRGPATVYLLTLTLPHDFGEELETVLRATRRAFSELVAGRAWQSDKATFGLDHYVRAHDVTVGANGWHPHLHILLFGNRSLEAAELAQLRARIFERWVRSIAKLGRDLPTWAHGVQLEAARSREDVARYVCQVITGAPDRPASVAMEMTRGDLKRARHLGQRTPWQVLEDYGRDRNPRDLSLWRQWETATAGVHSIRWSKGLRALVGLGVELTDEQLVAIDVGGEIVWEFRPDRWRAIMFRPGIHAGILSAAEQGGTIGVKLYLEELGRTMKVDRVEAIEYRLRCRIPRAPRVVTATASSAPLTARVAPLEVTTPGADVDPKATRGPSPELGRASCRERVFRTV